MSEPKYLFVYKDMKEKIKNDVYKIGELLPPGEMLSKEYNVSKLTLKKAMDMLVSEGVLLSQRGYGTEVIKKPSTVNVFGPNDGLLNVVGEHHVKSKVHMFSISLPTEEIATKLNIEKDEYIYHIIRSRFLDSKPYSIEEIYMPIKYIPSLEMKHLKKSVYTYIKNELGLETKTSLIRIKGVLSDKQDSEILGIETGCYMVELEKYAKLLDGKIFEYSKTKHLYEDFLFEVSF